MPLTGHDLIFADLTAFAPFIGARFALRGKSDAAGIARLEQKINSILSHLGLTGDGIPTANTPLSSIGSTYNFSVTEEIMDLIRRGKKIEAIKLYRQQNPGTDLLGAKNAIEQIERTGM